MGPNPGPNNVKAFETLVKVLSESGGPALPFDRWHVIEPIYPIGGRWYFSFTCPSCKGHSPLFHDYADGNLGSPFVNCGYGVVATCFFCQARHKCPSADMQSRLWPLAPGQSPPVSEYAHRVQRKYKDDPEYRPLGGNLHHYTSVPALLSIIKSKCLWATHIQYLNDDTESVLGLSLMQQVATEALVGASGDDAEILKYFLEWIRDPQVEGHSVYVLSLSEGYDQLSQWRGYTPPNQGVCLSIDSRVLVERMQAQGWTFQICRYKQQSQLTWADAILGRIRREAATKYASIAASDDKRAAFTTVLKAALSSLLQTAATIKHDSFFEEREVRFISPMIHIDDPRVMYRSNAKHSRLPYVNFQLAEPSTALQVDEVMVGPGIEKDSRQSAIDAALKADNVKGRCKVSVSRSPLIW